MPLKPEQLPNSPVSGAEAEVQWLPLALVDTAIPVAGANVDTVAAIPVAGACRFV